MGKTVLLKTVCLTQFLITVDSPYLIVLHHGTDCVKVDNVDTVLFMFKDHAKKTVTVEAHPHLPMTMASVHPCR